MTRQTILLLTAISIFIVLFTFTLPFVQRDMYTSQSIIDLFTNKQPKFLSNRVLNGDYYKSYLFIAVAYLIIQTGVLLMRNSKLVAVFNAIIGVAGLMLVLLIGITLYTDNLDKNFVYLSGFYLFIITLIAKNVTDWLYLRSILKQTTVKTTLSKDQRDILDSTNL